MTTKGVIFNTIKDAEQFVNHVEQYPQGVDVCCGSYVVDGRSVLGILSLGIRKRLNVVVHN